MVNRDCDALRRIASNHRFKAQYTQPLREYQRATPCGHGKKLKRESKPGAQAAGLLTCECYRLQIMQASRLRSQLYRDAGQPPALPATNVMPALLAADL